MNFQLCFIADYEIYRPELSLAGNAAFTAKKLIIFALMFASGLPFVQKSDKITAVDHIRLLLIYFRQAFFQPISDRVLMHPETF